MPRSVRLAAWGTAVLRGESGVSAAVAAVTRDDEPHDVGGLAEASDLATLLTWLPGRSTSMRVALPVPGDVGALPGPSSFNLEALDSGECALADPGVGMVPVVTEFGSEWEPGAMVTWHVHEVSSRRTSEWGSLGEAERALAQALREATEVLATLDVARWRDDAATRILSVRDGALPRDVLPPSSDPRAVRVLGTAARVRAIVALAAEDDGAAISGWEAHRRAEALIGLDGVARRAMAAAVDASLAPAR